MYPIRYRFINAARKFLAVITYHVVMANAINVYAQTAVSVGSGPGREAANGDHAQANRDNASAAFRDRIKATRDALQDTLKPGGGCDSAACRSATNEFDRSVMPVAAWDGNTNSVAISAKNIHAKALQLLQAYQQEFPQLRNDIQMQLDRLNLYATSSRLNSAAQPLTFNQLASQGYFSLNMELKLELLAAGPAGIACSIRPACVPTSINQACHIACNMTAGGGARQFCPLAMGACAPGGPIGSVVCLALCLAIAVAGAVVCNMMCDDFDPICPGQ